MRRSGVPLTSPDDAIEHRALDGGIDVPRIVSNAMSVATSASSVSVSKDGVAVVDIHGPDGSKMRVAAPRPPAPPAPPVDTCTPRPHVLNPAAQSNRTPGLYSHLAPPSDGRRVWQ